MPSTLWCLAIDFGKIKMTMSVLQWTINLFLVCVYVYPHALFFMSDGSRVANASHVSGAVARNDSDTRSNIWRWCQCQY